MKSYTVKEVAEMLQVNPETVRRWIRDNKLHAQKTSNKGGNKITESDLQTFLKKSPVYAAFLPSLLMGGLTAPATILAAYAAGKIIDTNELNQAKLDNDSIVSFIHSEISSHKSLITRKRESIQQIEREISAEQNRIKNLERILESIESASSSSKRDKPDEP